MPRGVFQPVGQKRLTNVAVVRAKRHGKRFEIAAYCNTVVAWRNGVEKDIDNVLQTTTVFTNVSKGVVAKAEELEKAFGTSDEEAVCRIILEKGELQVSELERKTEYGQLWRDVVTVLVEKCVNPETRRPYTFGVLERALRDLHFNVDPKRPAKQQAFEALALLRAKFPIERAQMRFRLIAPAAGEAALRAVLEAERATVEREDIAGDVAFTCTVDPGSFRACDQAARDCGGRLEVLALAVVEEGHSGVDAECVSAAHQQQQQRRQQDSATALASSFERQVGLGGGAGYGSGYVAAQTTSSHQRPAAQPTRAALEGDDVETLYARGPVAGLPEEYESRRKRFEELDTLQPGWEVELRQRKGSSVVDACFWSPAGEFARSYADARRAALKASKG